jgi:hypothetical protein
MSEHWHYATSMSSKADPAIVETMTSPETSMGKRDAKLMLQPLIRQAQQNVRYADPVIPGKQWEPADWWMHNEEQVWARLPTAQVIFAVYPCTGDCAASAIAHRDELAAELAKSGMDVTVEPVKNLN